MRDITEISAQCRIASLQRILPPKMPFFVRQKAQISSKMLPQIPNVLNFVKFSRKSIFSSQSYTNPEFCQFSAIRKWGPFSSV